MFRWIVFLIMTSAFTSLAMAQDQDDLSEQYSDVISNNAETLCFLLDKACKEIIVETTEAWLKEAVNQSVGNKDARRKFEMLFSNPGAIATDSERLALFEEVLNDSEMSKQLSTKLNSEFLTRKDIGLPKLDAEAIQNIASDVALDIITDLAINALANYKESSGDFNSAYWIRTTAKPSVDIATLSTSLAAGTVTAASASVSAGVIWAKNIYSFTLLGAGLNADKAAGRDIENQLKILNEQNRSIVESLKSGETRGVIFKEVFPPQKLTQKQKKILEEQLISNNNNQIELLKSQAVFNEFSWVAKGATMLAAKLGFGEPIPTYSGLEHANSTSSLPGDIEDVSMDFTDKATIAMRYQDACKTFNSKKTKLSCPYLQQNTCYGEYCSINGVAQLKEPAMLFSSPDSPLLKYTAHKGEFLVIETTNVYSAPCQVKVMDPSIAPDDLKKGDIITRLSYSGGGAYNYLVNGRMIAAYGEIMPAPLTKCVEKDEMWHFVRTETGVVGWVNNLNFNTKGFLRIAYGMAGTEPLPPNWTDLLNNPDPATIQKTVDDASKVSSSGRSSEPKSQYNKESAANIVNNTCALCHKTGMMNAPKLGNASDWAPSIAKGVNTLYSNAINGFNMMPARGGNADLSDGDIKAAVDYMLSGAQDKSEDKPYVFATPNTDIVGLRLGMSPVNVKKIIVAHNSELTIKEIYARISFQALDEGREGGAFLTHIFARKHVDELIQVGFLPPPYDSQVVAITRHDYLEGQKILYEDFRAALIKKYGEPAQDFSRANHTLNMIWHLSPDLVKCKVPASTNHTHWSSLYPYSRINASLPPREKQPDWEKHCGIILQHTATINRSLTTHHQSALVNIQALRRARVDYQVYLGELSRKATEERRKQLKSASPPVL